MKCTQVGKTVRCECGGQLAISGVLRPAVDLGFGFKGGKFEISATYAKNRIAGYSGFCMKCRKEGKFELVK